MLLTEAGKKELASIARKRNPGSGVAVSGADLPF
jgi:hypothetical protein